MYEDNLDYAAGRLTGCFIQHKGLALFVKRVGQGEEKPYITSVDVLGGIHEIFLEDLVHTPIPLGYVPQTLSHIFVERSPKRKWKQGIHPESTYTFLEGGIQQLQFPTLKEFQKLVEGNYQSREVAYKHGGAFSPNFYVSPTSKNLFYKSELVGNVSTGKASLLPGKEYLYRRLEKTQ